MDGLTNIYKNLLALASFLCIFLLSNPFKKRVLSVRLTSLLSFQLYFQLVNFNHFEKRIILPTGISEGVAINSKDILALPINIVS